MLKPCKHSGCAVCKHIRDREVFKQVLRTLHPEVFICPHASYRIINHNGGSFVLPSLEFIRNYKHRFYVMDVYTTHQIVLDKDNFKVVCTKEGECNCEPFVTVVSDGDNNKDDQ